MSHSSDCPFCQRVRSEEVIVENERAVAFHDAFPVSPGHTLIVPRDHEADYFALEADQRHALWSLIDAVRDELETRFGPAAYNIGINAGRAAGQTVSHAHVHVIPRYEGDVEDPRGGIRHVIPRKAAWWEDRDDATTQ